MSNPAALKLYRDLLRTIKNCYTKNLDATMRKEIRYHFQGNALHNCETANDIALGYRIIKIIKERQ
jgi:hypothetical protein